MTLRRSNVSCRSSEWNAMQTVMHFLRRSEYSSGISPNTSDSSIRYENGDRQAHIWYRVPVHFSVRQSHLSKMARNSQPREKTSHFLVQRIPVGCERAISCGSLVAEDDQAF